MILYLICKKSPEHLCYKRLINGNHHLIKENWNEYFTDIRFTFWNTPLEW